MRFSTFQAESLAAVGPGRNLRLDREGDLWRVRSPYRALADVQRVEGILAELTGLRVADGDAGFVADDVKDLGQYGLAPPLVSITVEPKAGGGTSQTIHLGKPTPGSTGRYYARRGDQDDVVLVDVPLLKDLGESPAALHGKKVADIRPDRVDFVRFTSGGATVTASRTDKGWTRLEPLVDRADVAAINDLLRRLDGLEASLLLRREGGARPPARQADGRPGGLAGSRSRIESRRLPASAPALVLTVGRVDPLNKTAFARTEGDPTVLGLPSTFLDGLTLGSLAFRDRQVAAAMAGDLDRVESSRPVRRRSRSLHPAPGTAADRLAADWRRSSAPADPESVGQPAQAPVRPPGRHAGREHPRSRRLVWIRRAEL